MRPKSSVTVAILGILLILATAMQIRTALSWGHESYQITDWLINYAGGFVRRGLPGTIIGLLSEATGIQANHLAISASLAFYLFLVIWFLRRAGSAFPLSLILSCIVMGFPGYQDIVRKDCLGLVLLLGCLKAQDSGLPRFATVLIVNLLAALAILSHETFVFFALPALVILSRPRGVTKSPRDLLFRSLALAPAVLVFLLAACYHGTPAIATAVHESWMPLWKTLAPDQAIIDPAASIAALGWSSQQGLYLSTYMLTSGLYQPLCWVTVFAISFLLIVLFTGRGENPSTRMETKARVTALLVAQFVFISPLFILGVDYGRWLFILGVDYGRWLFLWLASSLMLHICERRAPKWLEATIAQVFKRLKIPVVLGRVPAKDWYLLFFGVPVIWNIHNFMIASPVIRHLDLVRSWF